MTAKPKIVVSYDLDLPPRCEAKRGPRGTVTCELPQGEFHDFHIGRGKGGRTFMWPVGCREDAR